jgi:hypothetical protein
MNNFFGMAFTNGGIEVASGHEVEAILVATVLIWLMAMAIIIPIIRFSKTHSSRRIVSGTGIVIGMHLKPKDDIASHIMELQRARTSGSTAIIPAEYYVSVHVNGHNRAYHVSHDTFMNTKLLDTVTVTSKQEGFKKMAVITPALAITSSDTKSSAV